ncbi:fumarylacetoacetate hydrolase family protein [Streptomyces sp. NPDC048278]|uniref:fumarylacetoacetate hydrolase family protein n=1 Tax=unclassified Streptomyces TaxID=2593676 RepID=UPI00343F823C
MSTSTGDMTFAVPRIVSYLSQVLPLLPGDLVFTGMPSCTGWGRRPRRHLRPTDELVGRAEGIVEMRHRFSASGWRDHRAGDAGSRRTT